MSHFTGKKYTHLYKLLIFTVPLQGKGSHRENQVIDTMIGKGLITTLSLAYQIEIIVSRDYQKKRYHERAKHKGVLVLVDRW